MRGDRSRVFEEAMEGKGSYQAKRPTQEVHTSAKRSAMEAHKIMTRGTKGEMLRITRFIRNGGR